MIHTNRQLAYRSASKIASVGCHAHGSAWACSPSRVAMPSRGTRSRRSRRGFSLPEVLIAMTIGAVVFGLSVELLSVAMHADSASGQIAYGNQSIDRLAEQFRDDVRLATAIHATADAKQTAKQIDAKKGWTLELPNGRNIEYSQKGDTLTRTESMGKKISARDAFALGDGVTARVELQVDAHPALAALILEHGPSHPNADSPIRIANKLRVAAPIGWDRRFASLADRSQKK
jgi:prepilin-type N-terminal cleavage/methylation domain-containing protein